MKKTLTKILVCVLLALIALSTVSMYIPVSAASIQPYSYYNNTFSFKGSCVISRGFDGSFLDIKVRGTAANNNNETVTMKVLIEGRNVTKTYTFLTDGKDHEYKNIFLGFSGSGVAFNFVAANPEITLTLTLETIS